MSALQNTTKQKTSPRAALCCCSRRRSSSSRGSDSRPAASSAGLLRQGCCLCSSSASTLLCLTLPTLPGNQLLLPLSSTQQAAHEVLQLPEMQRDESNALSVRNYYSLIKGIFKFPPNKSQIASESLALKVISGFPIFLMAM